MIGEIEKLGAELEVPSLAERDVLQKAEINDRLPRSPQHVPRAVAEGDDKESQMRMR